MLFGYPQPSRNGRFSKPGGERISSRRFPADVPGFAETRGWRAGPEIRHCGVPVRARRPIRSSIASLRRAGRGSRTVPVQEGPWAGLSLTADRSDTCRNRDGTSLGPRHRSRNALGSLFPLLEPRPGDVPGIDRPAGMTKPGRLKGPERIE